MLLRDSYIVFIKIHEYIELQVIQKSGDEEPNESIHKARVRNVLAGAVLDSLKNCDCEPERRGTEGRRQGRVGRGGGLDEDRRLCRRGKEEVEDGDVARGCSTMQVNRRHACLTSRRSMEMFGTSRTAAAPDPIDPPFFGQ
ncbi:unnamed protein product [Calypogeia fissa]